MLSKNKSKYIQSLRLKKNREKNNAFVVEGTKIIEELLVSNKFEVEVLCATDEWLWTNPSHVTKYARILHTIDEKELKKISNLSTPNQVLAVVRQKKGVLDANRFNKGLSLYFDAIQDPGNMGTLMRIADWYGIQNIFCSPTCVDTYNSKVIQATMGAFLRVNIIEITFEELRKNLPDMTYYGAALDGQNLYEMNLADNSILVIGNESKGISSSVIEQLTKKIRIPAGKNGGAESLNAAVATGIICAEFFRSVPDLD